MDLYLDGMDRDLVFDGNWFKVMCRIDGVKGEYMGVGFKFEY